MKYKTNELASLAGISSRTLRYYDQIGLLIPKRDEVSNYRYYDSEMVDALQQILLFKEMGIKLEDIKVLMKTLDKAKRVEILNEHLKVLELKKVQLEKLVKNVKTTISALKGETIMSDKEKFAGLKAELIKENDDKYKDEVISRWGVEKYEKSKKQFMHLTEEEYNNMLKLDLRIIEVLKGIKENDSQELRNEVANLHKAWLTLTWGNYNREAHLALVDMYLADERFTKYYDKFGTGLAKILRDSVHENL